MTGPAGGSAAVGRGAWREVSRARPCPVCGKPDWCSMSEDGAFAVCRRVDGGGVHRVDRAGADYWVHALDGRPARDLPDLPARPAVERADPDTLHRVYRDLLEALPLTQAHREALRRRGLTSEEITRRGYRTMPGRARMDAVRRLSERHGDTLLLTVPGFYVAERDGRRWVSLAGAAGILIPVRDQAGRIVALKVRRDDAGDGPKYLYVSSAKYGGPGPGSPVHVPLFDGPRETVRLTEGPLKADASTAMSNMLTVAIPGVSCWRAALPVLRALGARTVRLAFDADARRNRHVARALQETAQALAREGFAVEIETWAEEDGKGIDDLLAAGKAPAILTGTEALAAVVETLEAAREADPGPDGTRDVLAGIAEAPAAKLYEATYLGALAQALIHDAAAYGQAMAALRGRKDVSIRDLRQAVKQQARELRGGRRVPQAGDRPAIQVNGRYMREITEDAVAALRAANDPPTLFRRGTALVRVTADAGAPKVDTLTVTSLRGILDRCADFIAVDEDEVTPARPPADVVADILALPDLPFPALRGVSGVPAYLPGGRLLAQDGYDAETGLLLHLRGLGEVRTDMPVEEARDLLLGELLGDFPFADEASQAHTLAALLLPHVRPLIGGPTPLHLIDAPAQGTGKGLLADVLALVATGGAAAVMALPRDEDEIEKRITSLLLTAPPMVLLDNVTILRSTSLAAVLTATVWQGRRLGCSEMVRCPNDALWIAAGNNVELSHELARRTVSIRLDAGMERPEERTGWRHPDLTGWVREHRTDLVSACLSLVQAWIGAGMPAGAGTLGRFDGWARTMGGILALAGVPGLLGDRDRLHRDADRESQEWGAFCAVWREEYGDHAVTAKDLFDLAKERNLLLGLWGGRSALAAMQRIGHALAARRDRVFGGLRIVAAGRDAQTGSAAYRVEGVPGPAAGRKKFFSVGGGGSAKTPETPETHAARPESLAPQAVQDSNPAGVLGEAGAKPRQNPGDHRGFSGVFSGDDDKTPEAGEAGKPCAASLSGDWPGVSGVSGVFDLPPLPVGENYFAADDAPPPGDSDAPPEDTGEEVADSCLEF